MALGGGGMSNAVLQSVLKCSVSSHIIVKIKYGFKSCCSNEQQFECIFYHLKIFVCIPAARCDSRWDFAL